MPMTISKLISNFKEDAQFLLSAHAGRLQLKAVEKGVPAAVRGVYVSVIILLALIALPFLLTTIALAFGLIFAHTGEVYSTIRSLTLGFCCLDLLLLIVIALLVMLKKTITTSIEAGIINDLLDKMEEKEQRAEEEMRINSIRDRTSADPDSAEDAEATEILRVSRDKNIYTTDECDYER